MTSQDVRTRIVEALKLDLIGPWEGHQLADERLPGHIRPSNWYLAGFVIPSATPAETSSDADEDEDFDEVPEDGGLPEESSEERRAAKKAFFPSSMGLSFLLPGGVNELDVTIQWGDYEPAEIQTEAEKTVSVWQRSAREASVQVRLPQSEITVGVPDSDGLELHVNTRAASSVQLVDHIQHEPGQMTIRQPLSQRGRHQKHLIPIDHMHIHHAHMVPRGRPPPADFADSCDSLPTRHF